MNCMVFGFIFEQWVILLEVYGSSIYAIVSKVILLAPNGYIYGNGSVEKPDSGFPSVSFD